MTVLDRREFLRTSSAIAAGAALSTVWPGVGQAEDYPAQELKWIVYQAPGGLIDTSTRLAQPFLEKQGFKSTIEYVRGASGRIARGQLSRSKPDGYTVMTEAGPEEVLGKVIFKADYRLEEFQPLFGWFINAFNIYAPKTSSIKTFADFVAAAKSRKVTVATIGKGGPSHLQYAILADVLGLNLQFVHFDGGAPAYSAVAGGHVDVGMGGASSVQWADTINFLTVFRAERDPMLPDVPTIKDLGYDVTPINEVIYANAGPGVPADRIAKLQDAFAMAFADPELIEQQKKVNVIVKPMTAQQVSALVKTYLDMATKYQSVLSA